MKGRAASGGDNGKCAGDHGDAASAPANEARNRECTSRGPTKFWDSENAAVPNTDVACRGRASRRAASQIETATTPTGHALGRSNERPKPD
jgi:hypothetical protein